MVEVTVADHYEEARMKFPRLKTPFRFRELWIIDGIVDVIDNNQYHWDSYSIRILIPPTYPLDLPVVIETGRKIPRTEDWHNSFGYLCLGTEALLHRELSDGVTLSRWLNRHVIPYFANHLVRVLNGVYANGEFSHHEIGILEHYLELFALNSLDAVIERIGSILHFKSFDKVKIRHWGLPPRKILYQDLNALCLFRKKISQPQSKLSPPGFLNSFSFYDGFYKL